MGLGPSVSHWAGLTWSPDLHMATGQGCQGWTKWDSLSSSPPGTRERAQQQKKHSSFEEELSEVAGNNGDKARQDGQWRSAGWKWGGP